MGRQQVNSEVYRRSCDYLWTNSDSGPCKMQSVVAPSTQASELIQMYVAGKQVVLIQETIAELKLTPTDYPNPNPYGAQSVPRARSLTANIGQTCVFGARPLGVYSAYLRMLVDKKIVTCHKVVRSKNPADIIPSKEPRRTFSPSAHKIFTTSILNSLVTPCVRHRGSINVAYNHQSSRCTLYLSIGRRSKLHADKAKVARPRKVA